jgi:hypothetical protein
MGKVFGLVAVEIGFFLDERISKRKNRSAEIIWLGGSGRENNLLFSKK